MRFEKEQVKTLVQVTKCLPFFCLLALSSVFYDGRRICLRYPGLMCNKS